MVKGSSTIIVNDGLAFLTGNSRIPRTPVAGSTVVSANQGTPLTDNRFINWINAFSIKWDIVKIYSITFDNIFFIIFFAKNKY